MSRGQSPPGRREMLREDTERVTVRIPESMLDELDRLVDAGIYKDRSKAIRDGIDAVIEVTDISQETQL